MRELGHEEARPTGNLLVRLAGIRDRWSSETANGVIAVTPTDAETAGMEFTAEPPAIETAGSLRKWVSAMGVIVALMTAISAPLGFLITSYIQKSKTLTLQVEHNAAHLENYIRSHEDIWQHQPHNLAEVISLPESTIDRLHQRIYDAKGNLVVDQGGSLASPTLSRTAPLLIDNKRAGRIEIDASLRNLLLETGFVALFAFALGFAVYFAVRTFPLRVLDRAVGELEATNHAYTLVNVELEHQNKLLQQREEELQMQNMRFAAAMNHMSQGLCMFDKDKKLVIANQRYARMYGIPLGLIEPGTSFEAIIHSRIEQGLYAGGAPDEYYHERLAAVSEAKASNKIHELTDGRIIAISHQPIVDGGWVATHEDITERRLIEARIAHMAHHDSLTDLANRVLLRNRMDQALNAMDEGDHVAVLCLDLDRFKNINDTLGHPIGDALLKAVARRLRTCVRDSDTIARLGGDEFAILQISKDQPRDATQLATRICQVIGAPFNLDDHQVLVDTSIGIAVAPQDGTDSDLLFKHADLALYRAKNEGRGLFRFFEAGMDEHMNARRDLEVDLRRALANGEFELYYQPLINLAENTISGFEALLRWRHPTRGLIAPADFIPVAEDIGLIVPLGEWVLRQACTEAATWPDEIKIAVNLSPTQFKSTNLVNAVVSALANSGLCAGRLEIEITESVLLHDNEMTLTRLHQLRDLGVRICMDDFGTGYSSLSYLRSFPFDKIKIDRSFVNDLANGDDAVAIVRAVASLASKLGMATTAEGVETSEQLEKIRAEGCTEMQGYLFSPPRPADDILELILVNGAKIESAA